MNTQQSFVERFAFRVSKWFGSPASLIVHTLLFIGIFALVPLGVSFTTTLLTLTTIVSLEAIYCEILLQMTLHQHTKQIKDINDKLSS